MASICDGESEEDELEELLRMRARLVQAMMESQNRQAALRGAIERLEQGREPAVHREEEPEDDQEDEEEEPSEGNPRVALSPRESGTDTRA